MIPGFTTIDYVFTVIIIFSVCIGVFRGLIREVLSLVFLAASVILAFMFYREAGYFVCKKVTGLTDIAGFLIVFVLVMVCGIFITHFIRKICLIGPVKSVDRLLGALFGLLRGVLISLVTAFGIVKAGVSVNILDKSFLWEYLGKIYSMINTSY